MHAHHVWLTGYNFLNWYLTLRSFHYSLCIFGPKGAIQIRYYYYYYKVYIPGDVHWARLEASALGSLIAACPA